ncbi:MULTISPECIES: cell wall metabolism sensor histidine kinase WalK [unclassified Exiguobacterium]|uniref:cell wall metabolism sensor histidine kinase WalK n=1 Tax=unclassified Exiguobacterium TaxID=2644629 RepID=UPI0008B38BAF|nr:MULTISPECIES: cell wall metabolism sensor histidine kinase WalK [unclassified Exiguobacterium]OGX79058.1 PAS domain-containing sensor histidine kinase [Exiguobacterium sp. SH31]TCI33108.1 cell wall metabolism sensor histidine kinase WalK [Exiguobacterium sp. SH4S7]TCI42228.1 cell wall metabolism sensor histidine kinase WalK [Exiguobacterium sp. SH5S32]TCI50140.1 cell wall metabolism sensor histidine kinase WalK [Exiguobacterium sp. SH1S4]TCI53046.1 cell wall metabolism sensor histidine kina
MKRTNFFKSIQWKLVVIYALLILVAMQVIGVYFVRSLERQYINNFSQSLVDRANLLSYNVSEGIASNGGDSTTDQQLNQVLDQLLSEFTESTTLADDIREVQIIDTNSVVRATSNQNNQSLVGQRTASSFIQKSFATSGAQETLVYEDSNERMRVVAVPIKSEVDGTTTGMIYIEASMQSIYNQMEQVTRILATGTLIALIITSILGILLSRTITRPIADMRRQAVEMRKGNFSRKVKVYSDDEVGQLAYAFNELTDELMEANATTEAERRRLTSVLENMSDGVVATDRSLRVILMNDQARDMIGVAEEEAMGSNLQSLLEFDDEIVIPEDGTMPAKLIDLSTDEELFLVRAYFSPIQKHSGPITGLIVVLHDVTEQEQVEQDRREFVANVSHELRTPLTTMRSYLEVLAEGAYKDDELAPRFLETTQNETERMIRLVNDLLQLSKMDSKEYTMQKVKFDFIQFFNDIIERHEMTKGETIQFRRKLMKRRVYVHADQDKMTQVIDNIITNAVKFSPEGGTITFRTMLRAKRLVIGIKDEGVGIPKSNLKKIFERFYRVDKARARNIGGTGLGLSIAKEVVSAHGGDIWAESEFGRGTTIYFTIPFDTIVEVND